MENNKIKKPFYKKWWVWVIAIIVIFSCFGQASDPKSTDVKPNKNTKQENKKVEVKKDENKKVEVKKDENIIPELPRENIIGVSNKDFKKLSEQKPTEVRNDTTGNWRLTTISDNCDIKDYALSYYNENFENNNQIHAIVNFTNNTTTSISDMGNLIEVRVLEHIEKEEHDAKKLFGGMELAQYWIYKDNGEIEKIK